MVASAAVLFADHAAALGGAERSLLLLLAHLDRSQWQPMLACAGGALAESARALGVLVVPVPMTRLRGSAGALGNWIGGARNMARVVRKHNAQALIANTTRAAFYAALASRLSGVPFVWYKRDFWLSEALPQWRAVDAAGQRLLCAAAAALIANSKATAEYAPGFCRTRVVQNGIDVGYFAPMGEESRFRTEWGLPENAPTVGMVGRLRPWKGHDRFLRVLAEARDVTPRLRGIVVGGHVFGAEDGYGLRVRGLAEQLGLTHEVVFTGQLDDPREAIAAMDVFVHPGDPEPFGLVNVEAMAMGKPVVAFAHGALPEIVAHGQTGMLVEPENEAAMAVAVAELINDVDRRRRMGRAAREHAVAHFSVERVAEQVSRVLAEVVH